LLLNFLHINKRRFLMERPNNISRVICKVSQSCSECHLCATCNWANREDLTIVHEPPKKIET